MEPTPGGFTEGMSYGWLHGATPAMKDYVRRTDSAFNECHGVGPRLSETTGSDPIKSTIEFVKQRYPDIPVKVIELFTKMKFHHRLKCINQLEAVTKTQRDFMKDGHFHRK